MNPCSRNELTFVPGHSIATEATQRITTSGLWCLTNQPFDVVCRTLHWYLYAQQVSRIPWLFMISKLKQVPLYMYHMNLDGQITF